MTHAERAERRKKIAAYVSEHGLAATAKHFGVSCSMISNTAREQGVVVPKSAQYRRTHNQKATPFFVLKSLIDGKKPHVIVKECGISRQRVSQIKAAAIAAGFEV